MRESISILRKFILGPPSVAKTIAEVKNKIILSAFRFSNQKEVDELLNFSNIEEMEWGRMVNEIYASGLVMVRLMLETITQVTENRRQLFFKQIRDGLFESYLEHLRQIGVRDEYVKTWLKLLKMRREEYWQDRNEHRGELPEPNESNPWVFVVAISGSQHIRWGRTSPHDPFFKVFLRWLGVLAEDVAKILQRSANRL